MIFHGRRVCHAKKPACGACFLARTARRTGSAGRPRFEAAKLVKGDEAPHLIDLADRVRAGEKLG